MEISYTRLGDYELPNLELKEKERESMDYLN